MHVIFIIFYLLFNSFAHSDDILISAERINQKISNSTRPVKVVTKETLNAKNISSIGQVATLFSGLQSSSSSGSNSFFIRGGENHHILYIVDDVVYNDPTNPNHSFDFSKINLADVEKIEFIKGPESILYGSDALSGVIKIYTKKYKNGSTFTIQSSPNYYDGALKNNGQLNPNLKYQISLQRSLDNRYSDASKRLNPNAEKDKLVHTQVNLGLEQSIKLNHVLAANFSSIDHKQNIDNDSYDDTMSFSNYQQKIAKVDYHYSSDDQQNEYRFFISRNSVDRHEVGTTYNSIYRGHHDQFDFFSTTKFSTNQRLSFGLQAKTEEAKFIETFTFKKNISNQGVFINDQIEINKFVFTIGSRLDHSDLSSFSTSYKLGINYALSNQINLKANLGTGFKSPNLYQLYSSYGNSKLAPEKSQNFDLEILVKYSNDNQFSFGSFQNTYYKNINYSLTSQKYENLSKTRTQGLEFELSHLLTQTVRFTSNYTYLDSYDFQNKRRLIRRANQLFNTDISYRNDFLFFSLSSAYVSHRLDYFRNNFTKNPSYLLVNTNLNYKISKNINVGLIINNIFNKSYEAVIGHQSAGREFLLKAEASF